MASLVEIYDVRRNLRAACDALLSDLLPVRYQDVPDAGTLEPPYIGMSWSQGPDDNRRFKIPMGLWVRDFFSGTLTLSVISSRGVSDHNELVAEVLGKLPDPDDLFEDALPLYRIADFKLDGINYSAEGDQEQDPMDRTDISIQVVLYVRPESWPTT